MERLQRILAARGIASRRKAEELIRAGRVTVDGQTVTELGTRADPARSEIRVDGVLVRAQPLRYIVLNKPRGFITTTKDERDRWNVLDLVQVPERVYPVGRLDRITEGLLLLTNDGELANRVMHPRYGLEKEYHVLTLERPTDLMLQRIRDGIVLDGKKVVPNEIRMLRATYDGLLIKVVLHEGMHHVVRRLMEAVGIPVERLRRVRVGPLDLRGIPSGAWRDLTPGELHALREAVHLSDEAQRGPIRRETSRFPRRQRVPSRAAATTEQSGDAVQGQGERGTDAAPARERPRRGDRHGAPAEPRQPRRRTAPRRDAGETGPTRDGGSRQRDAGPGPKPTPKPKPKPKPNPKQKQRPQPRGRDDDRPGRGQRRDDARGRRRALPGSGRDRRAGGGGQDHGRARRGGRPSGGSV